MVLDLLTLFRRETTYYKLIDLNVYDSKYTECTVVMPDRYFESKPIRTKWNMRLQEISCLKGAYSIAVL